MRPTFLLNTELKPVSALITIGEHDGVTMHTCFELVKDFETEYGKISAGTRGFVDYIDPENGTVELLMEGIEPALISWGNIMIMVPFQTDDLAECLRVTFPTRTQTQKRIEAGLVARCETS